MLPANAKNVATALERMAELERAIAEIYGSAGDFWKEDGVFWTGMAAAEVAHAENMKKMGGLLVEKPEEFEAGRPFNPVAIQTAMGGIAANLQKLRNGGFTKKQMLIIARDIEQSLLESKYGEIVKTRERDYQRLIGEVTSQTDSHKRVLLAKIAEAE